ncbi:integrase family protein [Actinobaculum suis]|uniref:Integrase family protein n=1 Tax=Actinobaculum suis TaxID=1657 RepID=A0A7Z9C7J0_9ACTO|nr:site-specific integrase [Actinobaculum suis]VDG75286.1 integrase family protein [Actinobaculum suis]
MSRAGRSTFGSLIKRGGKYLGRYRIEGRTYYTPTRSTRAAVRKDLSAIQTAIEAGTWEPGAKPTGGGKITTPTEQRYSTTLEQWFTIWVEDLTRAMESGLRSPNTVRSYISQWRAHILPNLGPGTLLNEVTESDIAGLWEHLLHTRARATAANVMLALSSGFAAARKAGILATVPAFPEGALAKPGPTGTGNRVTYTAAQLDTLIGAAAPEYRAAIALGSYGCLRSGEIAALRRDDITEHGTRVCVDEATKRGPGGKITIGPPKSRAGYRTITLPDRAAKTVVEHLQAYTPAPPASLLWRGPMGGAYVSSKTLLRAYRDACKKAGLPVGRFHDLRHSGLTLYGQAGATLADLMARAGHSDVSTVMVYQHSGRDRDSELAARMTE